MAEPADNLLSSAKRARSQEAGEDIVLGVLREHLAEPLAGDPHVKLIESRRTASGWDLYVYVDEWNLAITRPVAAQIGRAYDALAAACPSARMSSHVWELSERVPPQEPSAGWYTIHQR